MDIHGLIKRNPALASRRLLVAYSTLLAQKADRSRSPEDRARASIAALECRQLHKQACREASRRRRAAPQRPKVSSRQVGNSPRPRARQPRRARPVPARREQSQERAPPPDPEPAFALNAGFYVRLCFGGWLFAPWRPDFAALWLDCEGCA
jgi:hypothetical protein